jgi:hypothetical protein
MDPVWPTGNQVGNAYLAYNNGQDNGVDLGAWLLYRCTHSIGPLPPIGGFAQITLAELDQALAVSGAVYSGVNISQEAMNEYNAGQPFSSLATDWIGGHCVPILYTDSTQGKCITWGTPQAFSWAWWEACAEEAYIIFTPEQMAAPGGIFNGVNVAQLAADIKALGGTIAPPPSPPSPPAPAKFHKCPLANLLTEMKKGVTMTEIKLLVIVNAVLGIILSCSGAITAYATSVGQATGSPRVVTIVALILGGLGVLQTLASAALHIFDSSVRLRSA